MLYLDNGRGRVRGCNQRESDKNEGHKVMKFNVLQASVRAYQRNLNTHKSYKDFRKARAELSENNIVFR